MISNFDQKNLRVTLIEICLLISNIGLKVANSVVKGDFRAFVTNTFGLQHPSPTSIKRFDSNLDLKFLPDTCDDSTFLGVQVFDKTRIICSV